jgi:hypothetical protein
MWTAATARDGEHGVELAPSTLTHAHSHRRTGTDPLALATTATGREVTTAVASDDDEHVERVGESVCSEYAGIEQHARHAVEGGRVAIGRHAACVDVETTTQYEHT